MFTTAKRLLSARTEDGSARKAGFRTGLLWWSALMLLVLAASFLPGNARAALAASPESLPGRQGSGPESETALRPVLAPTPNPSPIISPTLPELWRLTTFSPDAPVCGSASWVVPTNAPNPSIAISVNLWKGGVKKILDTPLGKLDFGGGNIAYAFCTDIHHGRDKTNPRVYCLDGSFFSDWRVAWLVTHYPPTLDNAREITMRSLRPNSNACRPV